MRNVIVDTSPIQYLYQISLLELLPRLYNRAIIPQSVVEELAVGNSLGIRLPNVATLD
jgi:predicted nucleic acid-binding protein